MAKVQKDKQRSTKHTYKTKDRATRTPLNLTIVVALQNVWDFSNIQSYGLWMFRTIVCNICHAYAISCDRFNWWRNLWYIDTNTDIVVST
jgi:hypothetical protein